MFLKIQIKNNYSYIQVSSDNFDVSVSNAVVDIMNIFAMPFYQRSVTIFEILDKNI